VDARVLRSVARSATAAATGFARAGLGRFFATGGVTAAFAARAGAAGALRTVEAVVAFLRAAGSGLRADVFLAERVGAALVTLLPARTVETLPVPFFSPVVFAIAIPSLQEAGYPPGKKQTAGNLLLEQVAPVPLMGSLPACLQAELPFHVSPRLV
jgi:hypothetical protein